VFGRVVPFEALDQAPGFGGRERLVEGSFAVNVEIVLDQDNDFGAVGIGATGRREGPWSVSAHQRDRLHGWGGRTRTAESVEIEIRAYSRGICADLAETAQQRRFTFEVRRSQLAAAARILDWGPLWLHIGAGSSRLRGPGVVGGSLLV
jgi:hypothetical protein